MTEEDIDERNFNYKKPSLVLFFIMLAVILLTLGIDWVFTFFTGKK